MSIDGIKPVFRSFIVVRLTRNYHEFCSREREGGRGRGGVITINYSYLPNASWFSFANDNVIYDLLRMSPPFQQTTGRIIQILIVVRMI